MSDYIYEIGNDDFSKDNREYVTLITERGQQIAVALGLGGIPHKGRYDDEKISFSYDADYKDSVTEIIDKLTSDDYLETRREIDEHSNGEDCLRYIPDVAKIREYRRVCSAADLLIFNLSCVNITRRCGYVIHTH